MMANITHGMTNTRTYHSWRSMKSRCYYPKNIAYDRYGGRGITVCSRWLDSFENFLEDMGVAPTGLTLDRIDNDKGDSKDNCKWSTYEEQNKNRSDTVMIEHNGKIQCASDWSKETNISKSSFCKRLKNGWGAERSINQRSRGIYLEFNGECLSLKEWSIKLGVSYSTLKTRYFKGWTPEKILNYNNYNPKIEYNGEVRTLTEWAKEIGVKKDTLYKRIVQGWTTERALAQGG